MWGNRTTSEGAFCCPYGFGRFVFAAKTGDLGAAKAPAYGRRTGSCPSAAIMCIACSRVPITAARFSLAAFSEPGRFRSRLCPLFLSGRCFPDGIRLEGWELVLPLHPDTQCVTVAVPDDAVTLLKGDSTARIARVIHDLNGTVVMLQSLCSADAPLLRAVLPESAKVAEGDIVPFELLTERCLYWPQSTDCQK